MYNKNSSTAAALSALWHGWASHNAEESSVECRIISRAQLSRSSSNRFLIAREVDVATSMLLASKMHPLKYRSRMLRAYRVFATLPTMAYPNSIGIQRRQSPTINKSIDLRQQQTLLESENWKSYAIRFLLFRFGVAFVLFCDCRRKPFKGYVTDGIPCALKFHQQRRVKLIPIDKLLI